MENEHVVCDQLLCKYMLYTGLHLTRYILLIITVLKGNNLVALYLFLFLYIDMTFLSVETLQIVICSLGRGLVI